MIKLLIGGSPCTKWSIAQKQNRETEPSGIGWELFLNYIIARDKFKPDFFLYENNESAAPAIKAQISKELGVELAHFNSALVSAQNRARIYGFNWTVEPPENRHIYLRDVLESGIPAQEKSYCLTATYGKAAVRDTVRGERSMVYEPVGVGYRNRREADGKLYRRFETDGDEKANALTTVPTDSMVAEPVCLRYERTEEGKELRKKYEAHEIHHGFNEHRVLQPREDGKTNTISTVMKDNEIAVPIRIGTIEAPPKSAAHDSQWIRVYSPDGKAVTQCSQGGGAGAKTGLYACPVEIENVGECETVQKAIPDMEKKYGYVPEMFNPYNRSEVKDKSQTLTTGSMVTSSCATCIFEKKEVPMFDYPHGFNKGGVRYKKKANTLTSNGRYENNHFVIQEAGQDAGSDVIYEVRGGMITIKGKQYKIRLADGFYIIRKLTVTEASRCQTLPDDYCRAVSASRAYNGIGNGWTAEMIIHILNGALKDVPRDEELVVLSMYDGIGTGRYCLDMMGFTNIKYYAYEIDKYAMKIAMSNYPDIIQCGDAFAVREDGWHLPATDKCPTCKHNTNDFVCRPECGGCDGQSHHEERRTQK